MMKQRIKKTSTLLLLILIFTTAVCVRKANAAETTPNTSGVCGDNIVWSFFDGTMNISLENENQSGGFYIADPNKNLFYQKKEEVKKVVIGEGITSVNDYLFYQYSEMTEITLPDSIESIGYQAFYDCNKLEKITLGKNCKKIGDYAFNTCTFLMEVDMKNVETIGERAFSECTNLTTITIPSTVKTIEDRAFMNCVALSKVNIKDINSWCAIDFANNYSNPIYYAKSLYKSKFEVTAIKEEDLNKITEIKPYTFCNYESLNTLGIPGNVKTIKNNAFYFGDGSSNKVSSISIPGSISIENSQVFSSFINLENVTITGSGDMTNYDSGDYWPWYYSKDETLSVTINDGITSIGDYVFSSFQRNTVELPDSIKRIGKCAFYNCTNLTSIEIPESVTEIGENAFNNSSSLKKVTFKGALPAIGENAFYNMMADVVYPSEHEAWTNELRETSKNMGGAYQIYWVPSDGYKSVNEVTATPNGRQGIDIQWVDTGADQYIIYYKTEGQDWTEYTTTSDNSATFDTAEIGKEYSFRIGAQYRSYNETKEVAATKTVSAVPILSKIDNIEIHSYYYESDQYIRIIWSPSSVDMKSYKIFKRIGDSGEFEEIIRVDENSTDYVDKDVSVGTKYYYYVIACADGEGDAFLSTSDIVMGRCVPDVVYGLSASVLNKSSITLSWAGVSGAQGYKVYRSTSPNGDYGKEIAKITDSTYIDTGLTLGQTYYYKVCAYVDSTDGLMSDSISIKLEWKEPVEPPKEEESPKNEQPEEPAKNDGQVDSDITKEPEKKLSAPKNLKVTSAGYNSIKVSWKKVSMADGYIIYRSTSKKGTFKKVKVLKKGSTVSYTDRGLTSGKKYYYKVAVYKNENGKQVLGNAASIKYTKPVPAKTTVSLKSAGKKKITVKWKKVSGASGYEIYRSTKKSKSYKKIKTVKKGTTVSFKDTNLKKGKKYYYKVRAYRTVKGKKVYASYSSVKSLKSK